VLAHAIVNDVLSRPVAQRAQGGQLEAYDFETQGGR
jgi:hypothetical protein